MQNYWIVGANWSGHDQKEKFYKLGFWEMGWRDDEQPNQAEKRDEIKENDRIAIKTMDGQGRDTITIHAIGIVKGNDDKKIHIDWLVKNMNRQVYSKGCFSTIHGPFKFADDWTKEVFCL